MAKTDNNNISALVKVMRPGQWVKNGFVLAPLVFSGRFTDSNDCVVTLWALIGFCLASSGVYVVNDLCDRNEDRQHPTKKNRPIACGAVGAVEAMVLAGVLCASSLTIGGLVNYQVCLMVLLYLVVHFAYSLFIKHIAVLDVMTIAGGFVLRILGGSFAIAVGPSHWLVLCTIMISMFLGFTKRRAELLTLGVSQGETRVVLKDYSLAFLDQVIPMVTAATLICYTLYTVDKRTVEVFGTHAMLLTVPSVMYGLFRYIYIIYHLKQGQDPTGTLLHDFPTILNPLIWVIIAVVVVSYGERIHLFANLG